MGLKTSPTIPKCFGTSDRLSATLYVSASLSKRQERLQGTRAVFFRFSTTRLSPVPHVVVIALISAPMIWLLESFPTEGVLSQVYALMLPVSL